MAGLVAQARKLGVKYLDEHFVIKLFVKNDKVCGALALDFKEGILRLLISKSVLIASGGGGRMYKITTNARSNTADGFAAAGRMYETVFADKNPDMRVGRAGRVEKDQIAGF